MSAELVFSTAAIVDTLSFLRNEVGVLATISQQVLKRK